MKATKASATNNDLKSICEFIIDCEHATAPIQETGYPSIRTPNVGRGRLILEGVNHVSEETYNLWTQRAVPREGDLILAREAPVGNVAIIPKNLKVCLGQRTVLIRPDRSKVNPDYLVYLLLGDEIQGKIQSLTGGATVAHLNMVEIRKMELPALPPLPTQQKVAATLSAYDDLIGNSTRRIKILEEMAQALYREWFVNFRFPGHEGVRMVETELGLVPEGWEVKRLDEVADVIDCLHGIKPTEVTIDDEKFGILLHVWNIGDEGKLDLSKKFFITEEVYRLWTKRIEVTGGDCVITNVGRIGAVAQIPFYLTAAIGRNMTAIRCHEGIITPTYLIEYLRSPYFEREKNLKQDSGTVMGSLNVKGIIRLNIPIPSFNLVKEFEMTVRPFRYRIEIFQKQNDNLRRTRDLLLPKLISGEIDMSKIDIRIPEAEA